MQWLQYHGQGKACQPDATGERATLTDPITTEGGRRPTLRQLQKARTRQLLSDVALELFEKQGYEATTVEEIASAAGVAARTFSLHFESKADVLFLFSGFDERQAWADNFQSALSTGSLWEVMCETSELMIESIQSRRDFYLLRCRLCRESPPLRATELRLNEDWANLIAGVIGAEFGCDPETSLAPRLVAGMWETLSRSAIELWALSRGTDELRGFVRDGLDLLRPSVEALEDALRAPVVKASPR